MKQISTKKIVLTAFFTAIVAVSTMFIRIPLLHGYVNLGDMFIFLAVFILGPISGMIAGGVGGCIADLFGYVQYAPITLVVKAIMALVVWFVYLIIKKLIRIEVFAEIISGVLGSVVMAFGYFVYEWAFYGSVGVAVIGLPWNLLQGAVGVALSVSIMRVLKAVNVLDKIRD